MRIPVLFLALTALAQNPAVMDRKAPELTGREWLNSEPHTLASRTGKVTVVHFWTFGCVNCRRNLPIYERWDGRFREQGVEIIGIHSPEFDHERVPANVAKQAQALGVRYPVLLDPNMVNWNRWRQQYWPAVYLIDKQGRIRASWFGEMNYRGERGEEKMTAWIEKLLAE
jgi:thiol-disulfide isomerase/thioredoxin